MLHDSGGGTLQKNIRMWNYSSFYGNTDGQFEKVRSKEASHRDAKKHLGEREGGRGPGRHRKIHLIK